MLPTSHAHTEISSANLFSMYQFKWRAFGQTFVSLQMKFQAAPKNEDKR